MVLYEVVTGQDRMDFPELPDDFEPESKETWRALNSVICTACASERGDRYADGAAMAEALGEPASRPKRRVAPIWIALVGLVTVLAAGWFGLFEWERGPEPELIPVADGPTEPTGNAPDKESSLAPPTLIEMVSTASNPSAAITEPVVVAPPPEPKFGSAKVVSTPEHAEILSTEGEFLGHTPKLLTKLKPGPVQYVLHLDGHRDEVIQGEIRPGKREVLGKRLMQWSPPETGKLWVNSLGIEFGADGQRHVATRPVTDADYDRYREARSLEALPVYVDSASVEWEGDPSLTFVALTDAEKEQFCNWLATIDREGKYFGPGHYYSWESAASEDSDRSPFLLVADIRRFGVVQLFSEPLGAEVFADSRSIGHTPLMLSEVPVGRVAFEIRMRGYEPIVIEGEVEENVELELSERLKRSRLYLEGDAWTNSLGMRFEALDGFACCVWETRVRDFDAFVAATKREPHHKSDLPQTADHPVVFVSRTDAREFCAWLTDHERKVGWIGADHAYRLPTDLQWSEAAGLVGEGRPDPGGAGQS